MFTKAPKIIVGLNAPLFETFFLDLCWKFRRKYPEGYIYYNYCRNLQQNAFSEKTGIKKRSIWQREL